MEKLAELVRKQLDTGKTRVGERENKLNFQLCFQNDSHPLTASPPHLVALQANHCLHLPQAMQATGRVAALSRAWYPLVGTATLELGYAPLHEQIRQFASMTLAEGCNHLQLLPLFLLPGVHVREDIPEEVALAQQGLGAAVVLKLRPHIGAHPGLGRLLTRQWATLEADAMILLSHGSRRAGGNEPVEVVAEQLGAVAAYWSVSPTLEEQINGLVAAGYERIGILPYFLFAGGITDAIAQTINSLQVQFPTVQLCLGEPIGASIELAHLILDLIE